MFNSWFDIGPCGAVAFLLVCLGIALVVRAFSKRSWSAMKRVYEIVSIVVGIATLCGAAYWAGYSHRGYVESLVKENERPAKFRMEWGDKPK